MQRAARVGSALTRWLRGPVGARRMSEAAVVAAPSSSAPPAAEFEPERPSLYVDRVAEHYWATLAEDIAVLTYSHDEGALGKEMGASQARLPAHMRAPRDRARERIAALVQPLAPEPARERSAREEWESAVPAIARITLSISMPEVISGTDNLVYGAGALHQITGCAPTITYASRTVSKWGLKKDTPWAAFVHLYPETPAYAAFVQKLVDTVLPKIRNVAPLRGDRMIHASGKIAGFTLDRESVRLFPELEERAGKILKWAKLNVHVQCNAATRDRADAKVLLSALGIPVI